MKITGVEPILIAVPYEHGGPKPMRPSGPWSHMETLLVRLDTDAGITGWGEAFGFAASPPPHPPFGISSPRCTAGRARPRSSQAGTSSRLSKSTRSPAP